ncbi:peptidoglycan-binding domain-containing protein [Sphingomonas qilianensis]|uniref:Peptidoglycan-binding domain-containing protein n=1 Tax=Sphingomonas qilianensis TaxID=1736690 RepID=A0ABU9XRM5_9SPHN
MSREMAEVAERLIEEDISAEAFISALVGDDPGRLIQRALDPDDPSMTVIGWPGQRMTQPLARGDLVLRDRADSTPRLSVVDEPQPMTRATARRRALMTDGPLPGRYVRVLEPGSGQSGSRFARRLTGPEGLVLPNVRIVRRIGEQDEAAPAPSNRATIRVGSSGPAVAEAQARLNAVDASRRSRGESPIDRCPLTVDGKFGALTRAAVLSFQRVAFPADPSEWDGVVGPHTWAALLAGSGTGPAPTPPPAKAASVAFVTDEDGDHRADASAPAATALMFGLWDQAYDGSGNVRNAAAETDNFVGLDIRRFYIRVRDPLAGGSTVTASWRTLKANGSTDDAPASLAVTLTQTAPGSHVFVSKALMIVSNNTDAKQATHSGFTSGPDAGLRQRGESNHRLRRAALDGFVETRYIPSTGAAVTERLPVFQRAPDVRRKLAVRVVNYDGHATPADINGHFATANRRWAQAGLRIDPAKTEARNLPAAAKDAHGNYAKQVKDDAAEIAALNDLLPGSADNTLTVVFVRMPSSNAYTTLFERTATTLGDRFFVFINPGINPEGTTLAHELHHVLFNRPDLSPKPPVSDLAFRAFFPFNTNPSLAYGLAVPDARVRLRIQHLHSPNPDNDPSNDNVVNWVRRRRTTRFPFPAPTNATAVADSSTGNTLTRSL